MKIQDKAFRSLTEKQQEVWTLIMRDGMTQYRTASILGVSRNAVKDRITRARKHFKAYLIEQQRIEQNKKNNR